MLCTVTRSTVRTEGWLKSDVLMPAQPQTAAVFADDLSSKGLDLFVEQRETAGGKPAFGIRTVKADGSPLPTSGIQSLSIALKGAAEDVKANISVFALFEEKRGLFGLVPIKYPNNKARTHLDKPGTARTLIRLHGVLHEKPCMRKLFKTICSQKQAAFMISAGQPDPCSSSSDKLARTPQSKDSSVLMTHSMDMAGAETEMQEVPAQAKLAGTKGSIDRTLLQQLEQLGDEVQQLRSRVGMLESIALSVPPAVDRGLHCPHMHSKHGPTRSQHVQGARSRHHAY